MRRRDVFSLAGAATLPGSASSGADDLAVALTEHPEPDIAVPRLDRLAAAVSRAKQNYQACRYREVLASLPSMLRSLRVACGTFTGDDRRQAYAVSADAHHVAASILLKQEDEGLAWLAADRSVRAANLSEVPLMIGSAARIVTHALMWGRHDRALRVLQAASRIAPEEITSRPATRRLVSDLATTAPAGVRREARSFADALGVGA